MSSLVRDLDSEPDPYQLVFRLAEEDWIAVEDMYLLMSRGDATDRARVEMEAHRRLAWERRGYARFREQTCPECGRAGLARWRFPRSTSSSRLRRDMDRVAARVDRHAGTRVDDRVSW